MIESRTTLAAREDHRSFLFIMDDYGSLNLETETSLLLMQELLDRGHSVSWLQDDELALANNQPVGLVAPVLSTSPFKCGQAKFCSLQHFDAVLVRKDPPFNSRYLQLTLILDHLDETVLQFNNVSALRDFNEKLLPLRWPQFSAPTLVSMSELQVTEFTRQHQTIVLKPLDDCSGRGILKLSWDKDGQFKNILEQALKDSHGEPRFLMAQKFLAGVSNGDKRVFLLDGEAIGVVNRIPRQGNFLANIHQGARCEASELTAREKMIIATVAPFLRQHGIFMAGADFIDGYLTELNITSPSALRQINAVSGTRLEREIVNAMLRQISTRYTKSGTATDHSVHKPTQTAGIPEPYLTGLMF